MYINMYIYQIRFPVGYTLFLFFDHLYIDIFILDIVLHTYNLLILDYVFLYVSLTHYHFTSFSFFNTWVGHIHMCWLCFYHSLNIHIHIHMYVYMYVHMCPSTVLFVITVYRYCNFTYSTSFRKLHSASLKSVLRFLASLFFSIA